MLAIGTRSDSNLHDVSCDFDTAFNRWGLTSKFGCKFDEGLPFQIALSLCSKAQPRDPPILKLLRRRNFGTGRKFGADVGKRYGEGSEMFVFLGKRGRETVYRKRKTKTTAVQQNTMDSSAVLFFRKRKDPLGSLEFLSEIPAFFIRQVRVTRLTSHVSSTSRLGWVVWQDRIDPSFNYRL